LRNKIKELLFIKVKFYLDKVEKINLKRVREA
jgi:hypothetical protein